MTPRPSVIGRLAARRTPRSAWTVRGIIGVLVLACALFTLYPQHYRAAMSLTPTDPGSLGLAGAASQLGALNSVFGNQSAIEVSIKIATGAYVRQKVATRLKLDQRLGLSMIGAERWLGREVEVRSMRGGIVQIEVLLQDAELGRAIVAAYSDAIREELGRIARSQTAYKRQILVDLVGQASQRLTQAQSAYDNFRLRTRYSAPQAAIAAIGDRIPALEGEIKQKRVQLNAARQFFTDENLQVRQILAEISALEQQLAEARSTLPVDPSSVGRVVKESTEVDHLRRDLDFARALYDSYTRFLQGTSVEDMTSTANVRVLEPPYIDPDRQYNRTPMLLGILILLIGLAAEFYRLRPPVSDGLAA